MDTLEEIMSDEFALKYAMETLQDLDEHCDNNEQQAELAEVINVLSSILDTYTTLECNITLGEEDVEA